MNKFCLILTYESGECAYLTEKPDLYEALKEYEDKRTSIWVESDFKAPLPRILSAKLVRIFE